jgi:hypothetical protein
VLFHEGALTPADQQLLKQLTDAEDQGRANVRVSLVDLAKEPDEVKQQLLKVQPNARFPWLVVRYPEMMGNPDIVWSGRLDAAAIPMLLHSPARKEIAKRLTAGDSVVWVMLDSGDARQDEATAKLIADRLKTLPGTLKLPELTDSPDDKIEGKTPLKLAFSLLRVSRADPNERFLVGLLADCQDDLALRNDPLVDASTLGLLSTPAPLPGLAGMASQVIRVEPMVFPVFGRGRSLYPWVGKGITADNVEHDCRELIAPCSCTVKRMNPGFDLLIAADWEGLIGGQITTEAPKEPTLVSLPTLGPRAKTDPPTPSTGKGPESGLRSVEMITDPAMDDPIAESPRPVEPTSARTDASSAMWRNLLWVGIGGLAVLVIATFVLLGKHKLNQP